MKGNGVPELAGTTAFLDANVLFSAAYIENCRLLQLWKLRQVTPVTSLYAIGEIGHHIAHPDQQRRLDELIAKTRIVSEADVRLIPHEVGLPAKDRPILAAAIAGGADCLLTGDKAHFGRLYNRRISGVQVLSPSVFLERNSDRLVY